MGRPRVVPGTEPADPPSRAGERTSQVAVGLGGTLRVLRVAEWTGGGAILGIQTGVFARFDLEGSANDLIASDWLVGVPLELRRRSWSARVRFIHWSAHLGDEFMLDTGAQRLDFTFEAVEILAAYHVGGVRMYGGGARVLRSQLADASERPPGFSDDGTLQLGADGGWYPWAHGTIGFHGGVDLQWSDRTEWRRQLSGLAGLEVRRDGQSLRVGLSWFDGPSPVGQFFLNEESLWGFYIRIDL